MQGTDLCDSEIGRGDLTRKSVTKLTGEKSRWKEGDVLVTQTVT